ncbi:MAG: DUF4276 family protein [Bacteroidales bacterium]|nr:DUF4276 family protein [Bacteroidales bacterium]
MDLQYILISDGTSDSALLPIIDDALMKYSKYKSPQGKRADLSRYNRPTRFLHEKIDCAVDLYNPDLIFIHRDAEREPLQKRVQEIERALDKCNSVGWKDRNHVKLIPVRMTEAWLLLDQSAIKSAAGNPGSKSKLELPRKGVLEDLSNPKKLLQDLIKEASNLSGRRLKKLDVGHCIQLIPHFMEDFSPLFELPSYNFFIHQINDNLK